ncbi:MAG: class II glutamine amidotransferase [Actinomycetes bacterium]
MCRLMGYVSSAEQTLEGMAGPSFAEFAALSEKHCDGWGIASGDSHQAKVSLAVEPTQADQSARFKEITSELKSDGALLHLRWATSGLAVKEGNTHPFVYGDYSFIHNGGVVPADSLNPFVDEKFLSLARGETDSEKYFYLMMTEIEKFGDVDGILSAVRLIKEKLYSSSLNAMILTPNKLFIVSEFIQDRRPKGESEDYYDLYYRVNDEGFLVASSGWSQNDWTLLPNHSMLEVSRKSFHLNSHLI